jgi:hypothetical protein
MADRKRIVIVGDSYSDPRGTYFKYKPTHTWVDCLSKIYDVECYAKEGASNLDILQQVPDTSWDWVICSLAPIVRQGKQQFRDSRQLFEENKKAAFKLTRLPRSLVWSPFEDYKNLRQVHYMPWIEHNEFWIQYHYADQYFSREFEFTGCHFTREGNDLHYEWVCKQLK